MPTIKQQLLQLGMKKTDIDHHEGDLYVRKNDISDKFVEGYQFKNLVTVFTSQIDHELWYEIPFGYIIENDEERRESYRRLLKYGRKS